jgi:hypothetical protein
MKNAFLKIFYLYYDGFRNMTVGKNLWIIIIIKLVIIFLVLKIFFFPDFLEEKFSNDKQRRDYVINDLTNIKK